MNPKNSKKHNKHIATRRALRFKHGLTETPAISDSMRLGRRKYGGGKGK